MKEDVKARVEQSVSAFGCLPNGWWFESTRERSVCFFVSLLIVCLFSSGFSLNLVCHRIYSKSTIFCRLSVNESFCDLLFAFGEIYGLLSNGLRSGI